MADMYNGCFALHTLCCGRCSSSRSASGNKTTSLDMPVAQASRAAITHATPDPDEHAFHLALDDLAWGPLYTRETSVDVSAPGSGDLEIEVLELDDGDYADAAARRRSNKGKPAEKPKSARPSNVVADEREISLAEYDLDEPLHKPTQDFGEEYRGDFDLGLDDPVRAVAVATVPFAPADIA